MEIMKEREYIIELYAIYNNLLTTKQKSIFEKYYFEDLSLSEISENTNISKSYIGKTIQTTVEKVKQYESILNIHKKNQLILELIDNPKLKEKIKKIISG